MAALTASLLVILMNHMNERQILPLPHAFCWTRFGTEAGEPIEAILERKNREREANGGVFFWGIGNSVAPALAALIAETHAPEVLFSPMRSRPRIVDVKPPRVVEWAGGETLSGEAFMLPSAARVTSRGHAAKLRPHYALVCLSSCELEIVAARGTLYLSALRNLLADTTVGASQVTAVVRQSTGPTTGPAYSVAFRAALVPPYFVRLRELLPQADLAA
jgi:hypothetical protein